LLLLLLLLCALTLTGRWQQSENAAETPCLGQLPYQNTLAVTRNSAAAAAAMCCYSDRSLATERDLQLKQQAWDNFLITTHWPSHNVTVFPGLGNSESYYAANADAAADQADEQQQGTEQLLGGAAPADDETAGAADPSSTTSDHQGAVEQRHQEIADDTAVDAAAAGISSVVLGTTSGAEASEGDVQQQQQEPQEKKLSYWESRAADGNVKALLAPLRTRHRADDAVVRKLAGVEPYEASEVWRKQPLVDVAGAHPQAAR
jgi:hypothetical protein